jgi:hypothetical protein
MEVEKMSGKPPHIGCMTEKECYRRMGDHGEKLNEQIGKVHDRINGLNVKAVGALVGIALTLLAVIGNILIALSGIK